MNTDLAKIAHRNSIVVAIFIVIAIFGILTLILTFTSSSTLETIFAIIIFTIAVVLPIRQKRLSLYSLVLVVSGILFLLSGLIGDTYHTVVSPLPVLKQIELSKIMRPMQVSRGLSSLGIGLLCVLLAVVGLQFNKLSEDSKGKWIKVLLLIMAVLGVLFSLSESLQLPEDGVNSNQECRVLILPCPTPRAPDGWESPRFQAGFWLELGPIKVALSCLAHPRVTLTVRCNKTATTVHYFGQRRIISNGY